MSINDGAAKERESRIGLEGVGLGPLKNSISSEKSTLCRSTGFNASNPDILSSGLFSAKDRDWIARSQSALSANTSDGDETSISTVSSTSDIEEHRQLIQFMQSRSPSLYSSFCSGYSDSDSYCSTLEDDPSYESSFTEDSASERENYSDDDGHYNLIQPFEDLPRDSNADHGSSSDEIHDHVHIELEGEDVQDEEDKQVEDKKEFCVQCHAWPELEDCRDPPRNLYEECYHTRIDPKECAFGSNVHMNSISLSFVDENPIAVAKRKAIESALSSQFYLLIQQFAVNSEKVARILYGISVIDIVDLGIATTHALTEMERATVLAITLVRRLRRWPDLFGDVCKVLSDVPSMQEANAKVRQLLYEGCSEDQYSEILARNIEQQQQQQQHEEPTESDHHSTPASADVIMEDSVSHDTSDPVATAEVKNSDNFIAVEDSVSYTSILSKGSGLVATDEEMYSDIFANDPVSHATKMATEESDPVAAGNEKSDCACPRISAVSLHETCLENRSIRSLDALINDDELDINARDKNGRTPLLVACLCLPSETPNVSISKKQRKKIRRILENGADSSIQDYDGNTALHIAALRRDQEVVMLLLDRSYIKDYFNIAVTNKNCRTALHYACYWGDMELVIPILDFDKDAKSGLTGVRDRNGDTGLHIASRGGFKAVVKELLKANANREIQNKEGQTAADVAEGKKHNGIAKLLRRKKSRWLFPRKKSVTTDQTDCGMHRSSSCSSIGSNQSDLLLLSEESDIEFEDEEQ